MITLIVTLVLISAVGGTVLATSMTSLTVMTGKVVVMAVITLLLISAIVDVARGKTHA